VDGDAVRTRVDALFGSWKHDPTHKDPRAPPAAAPIVARRVALDRDAAGPAVVTCGGVTPGPDVRSLSGIGAARALLGGDTTSRLYRTLRDDLHVTNMRTSRYWMAGTGTVTWTGSVAPDRVGDAIRAIARTAEAMHSGDVTSAEVGDAAQSLARQVARHHETAEGFADWLAGEVEWKIPVDYDQGDYLARLDRLSAADVRAAAPDPSTMKCVVVGDLATLREPLLSLGWGAVEQRNARGAVIGSIAAPR
jgi:predicted Zn-dependent peptidase